MMQHLETAHYAVSVVGKDRPGIVAAIAEVLFRLGCNIADSSCTMLAGEFAMILIVSHPKPFSKTRLFEEIKPVCDGLGMSLAVRTLHADEIVRQEAAGEICLVSVYGADRPGIVYRVTHELAQRNVNIMDLSTKLVGSPAEPVYVMMLEAAVPSGQTPEDVEGLLESLKKELNVEIGVRTITPVTL
ncbi:glycine cleavage system protein R [Geobacter sp. SVR]|uniref:glycine cleavage system protein R n=1 Tax=Geobacter sp. SVR TaxID=2495594 RepID=UPI00143F02A0|nr:ACT domain-containing protein [Geobacter sp. SVR]BCS55693.1 amino acid-binding protein [Geobacter sp. SVR]GCF83697.1 amino acid-binding protein [Geobacter sp. SVR]